MSTIWTTQLTLSLKRVKHSCTIQQIAVIIAYLLLLSRRNAILMSPAAASGQNLYLEIARTRSDGKLDFAQPKQSSNQRNMIKRSIDFCADFDIFSPSKGRQKWRENQENVAPNVENRWYVRNGGSGNRQLSSLLFQQFCYKDAPHWYLRRLPKKQSKDAFLMLWRVQWWHTYIDRRKET